MNVWFGFIIRYLLIATIGTALVVLLIPQFQEARAGYNVAGKPAARSGSELIAEAANELIEDSRHFVDIVEQYSPLPEAKPGRVSRETTRPASQSTPSVPDPAGAAEPQENSRWGIASSQNISFYNTKGAFQGHLPPGELLEVLDIRQNKGELLAICKPASSANHSAILVKVDAIDIHNGRLEDVNYELRQLYVERAKIKIEIDTRNKQRKNEVRGDNPYAGAYVKARKAHAAYWQKVKDLKAGMATAEGADRVHYANELRKLKGQDIALRTNYDNAKGKYQEWNRLNPETMKVDPGIDPLAEELKRIESQISSLESDNV